MAKKWLTLYISEGPETIKRFVDLGVKADYLISFATLVSDPEKRTPHAQLAAIKKSGHKLMLDSGVITNLSKPGTVELEPYIEYLKSHVGLWDEYVTLDAIGSRSKTIAQWRTMKEAGLNPLFVDHLKYDHSKDSESIFHSEPKVCLAGWGTKPLMGAKTRAAQAEAEKDGAKPQGAWEAGKKRPVGEEMARRVAQRADVCRCRKTKVHMLAIGSFARFLPVVDIIVSGDTASPTRAAGYGNLIYAKSKEIGGMEVPVLGYCQAPFSKGGGAPVRPEVIKAFNAWRRSTQFKNETENQAARCWNVTQLTTYADRMNTIEPATLVKAWHTEKESKTKHLEKSATFFMPMEIDPWDGLLPSGIVDGGRQIVIAKAEDFLHDLVDHRARALLADDVIADASELLQDIFKVADPVAELLQEATKLQTLILAKTHFETLAVAVAWVKEHKFKPDFEGKAPDETLSSFRFRQQPPDAFKKDSFRTIEVRPGIKAVIGILKEEEADATTKAERNVALLPVDKAGDDRQIVFGVVLEPGETDTQDDTVDADEISTAAHLWLARYQDRGLMHEQIVNSKIEIFESYVAPVDMTIGGQQVKKGTWLLMYHITDDKLWADIKSGKLTGFSMGGFARRKPA